MQFYFNVVHHAAIVAVYHEGFSLKEGHSWLSYFKQIRQMVGLAAVLPGCAVCHS